MFFSFTVVKFSGLFSFVKILPFMSAITLNKSYALAALMIHGSNQEVSADKIKKVFEVLKLDFSAKLASKFVLPASKYVDLLTCPGVAAVAAPAGGAGAQAEEKEEKKEESSEEVMDF